MFKTNKKQRDKIVQKDEAKLRFGRERKLQAKGRHLQVASCAPNPGICSVCGDTER